MLEVARRMRNLLLGCILGLAGPSELLADGGELFRTQCAHCHSVVVGTPASVGPSLAGIGGRPAATVEGYTYSDAMKLSAKAGLVWDEKTLDQFLASPRGLVAGTNMGFPGMSESADRTLLIDWLLNLDASATQALNSSVIPQVSAEVTAILTLPADADYGEYLAGECVTCHTDASSASGAVPPINALPKAYFVQALLGYKSGKRTNSVMQLMAGNLGDEEVAALAQFFSPTDPCIVVADSGVAADAQTKLSSCE